VESIMLSCTIDAEEQREVATADIPGAFIQADMIDNVHVKLEGKLAELVAKIDPKAYENFIHMENDKKVMHVKLRRPCMALSRQCYIFGKHCQKIAQVGF